MNVGDRVGWHRQYDKGFYNNPAHETIWYGTVVELVTPELVKISRDDGMGNQYFLVLTADIKGET